MFIFIYKILCFSYEKSIIYKRTWKKVTSNYDFSEYINKYGNRRTSVEEVIEISKLLESKKYSNTDISNITGIGISTIYDIKNRKVFKDITKKFNF